MVDKVGLASALEEGRQRTWDLVACLSDEIIGTAACDFLSPPVWDLGHIANFEERWLVQNLLDEPELREGFNDTYNAFRHPRSERPKLNLLNREGVGDYMTQVRSRALAVLESIDLDAAELTRNGFVHAMIALHEAQHQETLLQTMVMCGEATPTERRTLPTPPVGEPSWVTIPSGTYPIGQDHGPGTYDNEAPAHTVDVPEFQIRSHPATNGEMLAFIQDGGYQADEHWSARGRQWRDENEVVGPLYWEKTPHWTRRNLAGRADITDTADEILCHVSYFEAEAFASWSGARLPTESEWEVAARRGGSEPWGEGTATTELCNIDHWGLGPSRAGAYPDGASPDGIQHLIGDVWEWTSSPFQPYPGFQAFPYDEYSQVFFGGDYRVLRGGSWATRAGCSRASFRNWDHPYRRQIFGGIRLARDTTPLE